MNEWCTGRTYTTRLCGGFSVITFLDLRYLRLDHNVYSTCALWSMYGLDCIMSTLVCCLPCKTYINIEAIFAPFSWTEHVISNQYSFLNGTIDEILCF